MASAQSFDALSQIIEIMCVNKEEEEEEEDREVEKGREEEVTFLRPVNQDSCTTAKINK